MAPERGITLGGPRRDDVGTRTYVIPQVRPSPERLAGAALSIGSLVIKVITFPVAKLVGMAARRLARDWDAGQHPSQVRAYGPDGTLTDLTPADWDRLAAGPALLFVHGTFSSTEGAFGRLPSATMAELHGRYGGRVIAFDHPTLADDPFVNARAFFDIVGDRDARRGYRLSLAGRSGRPFHRRAAG